MIVQRLFPLSLCFLFALTVVLTSQDESLPLWRPIPGHGILEGNLLSVASDSIVWISDDSLLYTVDPRPVRQRATIRHRAGGPISGLWARGRHILYVTSGRSHRDKRIFHSGDGGVNFNLVDLDPYAVIAYKLLMDGAGRPFLSCTHGKLLRTADSGATWELAHQFGGEGQEELMAVQAIGGTEGNHVVSLIDFAKRKGGIVNRLFRYQADSWVDISLDDSADQFAEWEVTRIGEQTLLCTYFHGNGLRSARSTDDGLTWSAADLGAPPFSTWIFGDLATGNVYYTRAAPRNGQATSSVDSGASYLDLPIDGSLSAVDYDDNGGLWFMVAISGQPEKSAIWHRDDRNEFRRVFTPRELNRNHVLANHRVSSIASHHRHGDGLWFVAADSSGVWKTTTHGGTWSLVPDSPVDNDMVLHFDRDNAVFLGSSSGIRWLPFHEERAWTLITDKVSVARMAVSTDWTILAEEIDGGLVRVARDGTVEQVFPAPQESGDFVRLVGYDQYNRVFVARKSGLYQLDGYADSWRAMQVPVPTDEILSICSLDRDVIFLGTTDGLYRSTDFGGSWSEQYLPGRRVTALEPASVRRSWGENWSARVVGLASDSVWSTVDTGNTWVCANTDLHEGPVTAVGVDRNESTIVAAVLDRGMFFSKAPFLLSVERDWNRLPSMVPVSYADGRLIITLEGAVAGRAEIHLHVCDLLGRPIQGRVEWSTDDRGKTIGSWLPDDYYTGLLFGRIVAGDRVETFKVFW